jgi:hypothetical protein
MVTILSHPLMVGTVLPFILVFTLVFAVLQKTKILGDGKKQIDALVALAIALIVVSFGYATGIIISLIPVLAIGVVVILIFMLLYGMSFHGDFKMHDNVKWTIGILAAIAVIIATMVATGAWDYVVDLFQTGGGGTFNITNLIFVVIIAIAVALVVMGGGGGSDKKDK